MEKTYTQSVHYKIVIEGDYCCSNLWEEDLYEENYSKKIYKTN